MVHLDWRARFTVRKFTEEKGMNVRKDGSYRGLAVLVYLIAVFAAVMAGYSLNEAGREKWGESAWTGSNAGAGVAGFVKGAEAKAKQGPDNPHPEVGQFMSWFNHHVVDGHYKLFSWLVVLGEFFLPIAILVLLVVKFPLSRALLVLSSGLACVLHLTFLSEGVSSTNPQHLWMWAFIFFGAIFVPDAVLYGALDVTGETRYETGLNAEDGIQWIIILALGAVLFLASLSIYDDKYGHWVLMLVVALVLSLGLAWWRIAGEDADYAAAPARR